MSEPAAQAASTWLLVLPPLVSQELLAVLRSEAEARGWAADSSRGDEQVILAIRGPQSSAELDSLLAGRVEADVLPLPTRDGYRRLYLRRRFLSTLVTGLGILTLTGLVLPLAGFLQPPPETIVAPDLVHVPGGEDLAVGEAARVRFHGEPVLVLRLAPERWQAVSATCTYLDECLLEWNAERRQLLCPCHGCAFDAHGNVVHAPAAIPLVRLEVVELGGGIYVQSSL